MTDKAFQKLKSAILIMADIFLIIGVAGFGWMTLRVVFALSGG